MKVIVSNSKDEVDFDLLISPSNGDNIYNPDQYMADGECDFIIFKIIDHIPVSLIQDVVLRYAKKIKHGGRIRFVGRDIYQVCLKIVNRELGVYSANEVIFGKQGDITDLRSSIICVNELVDILKESGLRITQKALNGLEYIVEAERG